MRLKTSYLRIQLANDVANEEIDSSTVAANVEPAIRPGSVLYGEVVYKPAVVETLTALTVCLLGKLVVKGPTGRANNNGNSTSGNGTATSKGFRGVGIGINNANKIREVTQLFSFQHPIVRKDGDPIELQPKPNRFPFHFIVPWTTEYDRTGMFKPDTDDLFVELPHNVPPSLRLKGGNAQILYSCYVVGRKKGMRAHEFVAQEDFPKGTELENIPCIVETPLDADRGPSTNVCKVLTPPDPPIPKSMASGLFRRGSTMSARTLSVSLSGQCTLTFRYGNMLFLGEQMQIDVKVDRQMESENETEEQRHWVLSVKNVRLVSRTYRRVKGVSEPWVDTELSPLTIVQKPDLQQQGESGNGVDKKLIVEASDLDTTISFRSYSISRLHELRIEIQSRLAANSGKSNAGQGASEETVPVNLPIKVVRGPTICTPTEEVLENGEISAVRSNSVTLPPAYEGSSYGVIPQEGTGDASLPPTYEEISVHQE